MLLESACIRGAVANRGGFVEAGLDTRRRRAMSASAWWPPLTAMMSAVFPIGSRATSSRGSAFSSALTRSASPVRAAFSRSTTVARERLVARRTTRAQVVGDRVDQHRAQPVARRVQASLDRRQPAPRGTSRPPPSNSRRCRRAASSSRSCSGRLNGFDTLGSPFILAARRRRNTSPDRMGLPTVERHGHDRAATGDAIALLEDDAPEPAGEGRRLAQLASCDTPRRTPPARRLPRAGSRGASSSRSRRPCPGAGAKPGSPSWAFLTIASRLSICR